jgi:hypothetical protein
MKTTKLDNRRYRKSGLGLCLVFLCTKVPLPFFFQNTTHSLLHRLDCMSSIAYLYYSFVPQVHNTA